MSKKMFIALPAGGLLDRAAMGTDKDVEVSPHKPVAVPVAYGLSLVYNRFAVEVDAEPAKKGGASAKQPPSAADEIAAAETAVADAKATVDAAGADMVAKADAEAALKVAEEALAKLKG